MSDFWARNRLGLIVAALIGSQFALIGTQLLTWQAVRTASSEIEQVYIQIGMKACGGAGSADHACRVVVIPP